MGCVVINGGNTGNNGQYSGQKKLISNLFLMSFYHSTFDREKRGKFEKIGKTVENWGRENMKK